MFIFCYTLYFPIDRTVIGIVIIGLCDLHERSGHFYSQTYTKNKLAAGPRKLSEIKDYMNI